MPEGLPALPSPDLTSLVSTTVTAPQNGVQVPESTANFDFAAIVNELLGAMAADPAESRVEPVVAPDSTSADAALNVADGNSLPPALPLALPLTPAVPPGQPAAVTQPNGQAQPALEASATLVATSRVPRPDVSAGRVSSLNVATNAVPDRAVAEIATALPASAPAQQIASESLAVVADKLVASPAAVSPPAPQDGAGFAAPLPSGTHASGAAAPTARVVEIPVPVQQNGWGEALGNRVAWLANQQIQSAELHLNPPQLGPIEVQIRMADNQASIEFGAHHAPVRDAIESALPRLREMFAAQGLNLADVNVSQQSFAHGRQQPATGEAQPRAEQGPAVAQPAAVPAGAERVLGLVDLYA
jgi:flagellar hook-length control protein FliK